MEYYKHARILRYCQSGLTLILLVLGTMGFLMDVAAHTPEIMKAQLVQIPEAVSNMLLLIALAVVFVWNLDWEELDISMWGIARSLVLAVAYLQAFFLDGFHFWGLPANLLIGSSLVLKCCVPVFGVVDLIVSISIYKLLKLESLSGSK